MLRADRVSAWCDDIRDAALVRDDVLIDRLDATTLDGVDLAMRLLRALGALDEYTASLIASHAADDVQVIAGGREKHLNRSMNSTLAGHFTSVSASLGQQKSRALRASGPRRKATWCGHATRPSPSVASSSRCGGMAPPSPRAAWTTAPGCSSTTSIGSPTPIATSTWAAASGLLATLIARAHPDSDVDATDTSWAAVDSTRRTAAGTGVRTHWAADLGDFADQDLDVIVCNPPPWCREGLAPTIALFEQALGSGRREGVPQARLQLAPAMEGAPVETDRSNHAGGPESRLRRSPATVALEDHGQP